MFTDFYLWKSLDNIEVRVQIKGKLFKIAIDKCGSRKNQVCHKWVTNKRQVVIKILKYSKQFGFHSKI